MRQWLERHVQTMVGSLGRLWQHPFAALFTILVIGIALALPACLHVLVQNVRAALDQVGLLGRERSRPIELSTGEQQRVGIARAIIAKPALLIADEPTGNLDPDLAFEIMNIFKRFNDVGVTVLIASHDVHLIERYGVRRVVLEGGRAAAGSAAAPLEIPSMRVD